MCTPLKSREEDGCKYNLHKQGGLLACKVWLGGGAVGVKFLQKHPEEGGPLSSHWKIATSKVPGGGILGSPEKKNL